MRRRIQPSHSAPRGSIVSRPLSGIVSTLLPGRTRSGTGGSNTGSWRGTRRPATIDEDGLGDGERGEGEAGASEAGGGGGHDDGGAGDGHEGDFKSREPGLAVDTSTPKGSSHRGGSFGYDDSPGDKRDGSTYDSGDRHAQSLPRAKTPDSTPGSAKRGAIDRFRRFSKKLSSNRLVMSPRLIAEVKKVSAEDHVADPAHTTTATTARKSRASTVSEQETTCIAALDAGDATLQELRIELEALEEQIGMDRTAVTTRLNRLQQDDKRRVRQVMAKVKTHYDRRFDVRQREVRKALPEFVLRASNTSKDDFKAKVQVVNDEIMDALDSDRWSYLRMTKEFVYITWGRIAFRIARLFPCLRPRGAIALRKSKPKK